MTNKSNPITLPDWAQTTCHRTNK